MDVCTLFNEISAARYRIVHFESNKALKRDTKEIQYNEKIYQENIQGIIEQHFGSNIQKI